jgi:Tfp pilus assembly protein FimV
MILVAASVLPSISAGTDTPTHTQTVAVRTSQSLWDLARAYPQDGKSTAQTVAAIRRLNDLEQSALTPGQLVHVPVQSTVFAADVQP